jgi:hypothetical protein
MYVCMYVCMHVCDGGDLDAEAMRQNMDMRMCVNSGAHNCLKMSSAADGGIVQDTSRNTWEDAPIHAYT